MSVKLAAKHHNSTLVCVKAQTFLIKYDLRQLLSERTDVKAQTFRLSRLFCNDECDIYSRSFDFHVDFFEVRCI